MRIRGDVYSSLFAAFRPVPPEAGGLLGGPASAGCTEGVVTAFRFDRGLGKGSAGFYVPDTDALNDVLEHWSETGLCLYGIVHSHCPGGETLSCGDRGYIARILRSFGGSPDRLYFPVIIPGKSLSSYLAVCRGGEVCVMPDAVEIV